MLATKEPRREIGEINKTEEICVDVGSCTLKISYSGCVSKIFGRYLDMLRNNLRSK